MTVFLLISPSLCVSFDCQYNCSLITYYIHRVLILFIFRSFYCGVFRTQCIDFIWRNFNKTEYFSYFFLLMPILCSASSLACLFIFLFIILSLIQWSPTLFLLVRREQRYEKAVDVQSDRESQAQKKSLSLQNLTQQDSLMMDICFATFFNIRLCAAH